MVQRASTGLPRPTMRKRWRRIFSTSSTASSRVATRPRQCAAATSRKRMARERPLGIPTFEDKVAQRAIVMLLEALYEQDFLRCSYGFRPGRSAHDALHDLRGALMTQGIRWVLDIDIKRYFDTIPHDHLRRFLDRRVTDGVIRRMIDKWLKAGVLESGSLTYATEGTPQGGVISPLLANIYLHYVLDEWVAAVVGPRMKGRYVLVRYADDFVMGFEKYLDARKSLSCPGPAACPVWTYPPPGQIALYRLSLSAPGLACAHPASNGTHVRLSGLYPRLG